MTTLPSPAWNQTGRPFPRTTTIPDLVRQAAADHPDRPALIDAGGVVMTHADLDAWSDRMAALLHGLGIGRGSYVALYSRRTPHAVAALLATLKSGAAYVPIDPAWPWTRTVQLLTDLGVVGIVTDRTQLSTVQELRWQVPSVRAVICPDRAAPTDASDWEAVKDFFDFLAGEADPLRAAGFNLRPSGHTFHVADVAAYQDHVARLAHDAVGERAAILEVGCGSGLIMEALAPTAQRYVAVDLSDVAVQRNFDAAARLGIRIDGRVCPAHEVADRVDGPFDLVVMASTVQFFPDLEYLLDSLESLSTLVRPGGVILLSDLIDPAVEPHAGLRVAPALVRRLGEILGDVAEVEVLTREPSRFAGELGRRYDAYLHVGADSARRRPGRAGRAPTLWTDADIEQRQGEPLDDAVSADDIAYAIFTSGSTGAPKGVLVTHRSVVNLIAWMSRCHGITAGDQIIFVASFCFDLSVYDMFGMLAAGASVRVATEEELAEPDTLIDIMAREPVTVWDSAPAALGLLLPFLANRAGVASDQLRLVLLSGDWIPLTLPDEVRRFFPQVTVVAMGGATECTVWSNWYIVGAVDPSWASIPYGHPMDNARYYVLDSELRESPVGVAGDLYIAGECVALGYAGDPALTATKFLADPWATRPGERMYRTGDRARWLAEGAIEFLGRLDDQIKVRGYRVELGEVQSALSQCPGVRAAVVAAVRRPEGISLAAFYIPQAEPVPAATVRSFLVTVIPDYMVPSWIIPVESFPLRDSGKVDRAALIARL